MQQYELLRVTKTGSESMKWAFAGSRYILTHHGIEGHGITLPMVPEYRRAIITLRDPVDRFRSAYDMTFKNNPEGQFQSRYPDIESFAEVVGERMFDKVFGFTYLPQVYWTRGADYMRERKAIWVMTKDIDKFIDTMRDYEASKVVHWNRTEPGERSAITTRVRELVGEAYAADYRMFLQLGEQDIVRTFTGDEDGERELAEGIQGLA